MCGSLSDFQCIWPVTCARSFLGIFRVLWTLTVPYYTIKVDLRAIKHFLRLHSPIITPHLHHLTGIMTSQQIRLLKYACGVTCCLIHQIGNHHFIEQHHVKSGFTSQSKKEDKDHNSATSGMKTRNSSQDVVLIS